MPLATIGQAIRKIRAENGLVPDVVMVGSREA